MTLDSLTVPYELSIRDDELSELQRRLRSTRLPEQFPGSAWAYGTDVSWLRSLVEYWTDSFDWRREQNALNFWPQFLTRTHDIDLHFLHVQGKGPNPTPLLLSHGWPGSIFEFLDIIPVLTDPGRFGGDPADSFTVVAPSLPGYGLSFAPGQPRFSISTISDVLTELMTEILGYKRFAVQGGDWGAHIATDIAIRYPEHIIGAHLNFLPLAPEPPTSEPADQAEAKYDEQQRKFLAEESGYAAIQGTKPQTLAFALTDSPAGLAAWIGEKFHAWTDHTGDIFEWVSIDRILANISLYWFTGAIGSSFWPYYGQQHGDWPLNHGVHVTVPVGYAAFPAEIRRPPRQIAERYFTDIRRWTEMPRGGHFAALEQPHQLAQEVRGFFHDLRFSAN